MGLISYKIASKMIEYKPVSYERIFRPFNIPNDTLYLLENEIMEILDFTLYIPT